MATNTSDYITETISFVSGMRNFEKLLLKHDKFIVTTHQSPDGDGLGSEIALNEFLNEQKKKSVIINSDPTPPKYRFLDMDSEIIVPENNNLDMKDINDSALIIVDSNSIKRTGEISDQLLSTVKEIFIIDHHPSPPEDMEKYFIMEQATSTGEIVYYIVRHFQAKLSYKSSQALYTSILTDTGSFRFPKTDWKTHRIVSELLKTGVNPSAVYQEIFENSSPGKLVLLKSFLDNLSYAYDGKLAFSIITDEMLRQADVEDDETEGLVNLPLENRRVRVSILLKAYEGQARVSLRSKGTINVSAIASRFKGGGHFNASGFRLELNSKLDIDSIKEQILAEFIPVFKQS